MAKKHNFWMCYQFLKNPNLLTPSITYSPKFTSQPLLSEDQCIQDVFLALIPHMSQIQHFSWIRVQSTSLHKGTYLLTKYNVDCPFFGKVIDILCHMSTLLQKYMGEMFHSHYNAFLIKSYGDFVIWILLQTIALFLYIHL